MWAAVDDADVVVHAGDWCDRATVDLLAARAPRLLGAWGNNDAHAYPDLELLVFGHTHIPWDSVASRPDASALRLLNPGSPTDRRRQPTGTVLTLELADGAVRAVRLHPTPPTVGYRTFSASTASRTFDTRP